MKSGIYTITSPSGKRYVGSAVHFKKRWNMHKRRLRDGTHHSYLLQRAWDKYGEEALSFDILLICGREDLLFYEQRAIDWLRPEYNISIIAGSPMQGRKHRPETIEKMSSWQLGRKLGDAHRASMSKANMGKKIPPETKAKISAAMIGRQFSDETRRKLSESLTGRVFSESHREAMSRVRMGKTIPIAQRLAHSIRMTGDKNPAAREVICCKDGSEFAFSTASAAIEWLREVGHPKASAGRISDTCAGNRKTAYGFSWRYAAHENPAKNVPTLNPAALDPASANPNVG